MRQLLGQNPGVNPGLVNLTLCSYPEEGEICLCGVCGMSDSERCSHSALPDSQTCPLLRPTPSTLKEHPHFAPLRPLLMY